MPAADIPDKQDMVLAFGFETSRAIAEADGHAALAEFARANSRFPQAELAARGLLGGDGRPTERYGRAYNLALAKLRSVLTYQEKLEMADAFFDVCRADAEVDAAEVRVIVTAMSALGVTRAQLADFMRARIARQP